jgi:hypothetical protein
MLDLFKNLFIKGKSDPEQDKRKSKKQERDKNK